VFTLTSDDGHTISTDPSRLDLDLVHTWLCRDAYWALGRDRETVTRAFAGSIGFGVYRPVDGRQVAVARVITDRATFGYLRDHLAELGVRRILLATNDAHGVYGKLGFSAVRADRWMELDRREQAVSPLTGKDQPGGPPLTVEP
jgi:hypothetical protein